MMAQGGAQGDRRPCREGSHRSPVFRPDAIEILAGAIFRLATSGWNPETEEKWTAGTPPLPANSQTLLSPPHRASMSGPGGAQTPPAKEDEHG